MNSISFFFWQGSSHRLPTLFCIIWFINRVSGRQDEGIKMGYLRLTILLWVDNAAQFWVACKLVKSTSGESSGRQNSFPRGGDIWFSSRGIFLLGSKFTLLLNKMCFRWCSLCPWNQYHIPISAYFMYSCPILPQNNLYGSAQQKF